MDQFIDKLCTLRQAPTPLGVAPHKPVLLLTILDLIENKCDNENHIYINDNLYTFFDRNWKQLVCTPHEANIKLPFYHLQNDLVDNDSIWQVITYSGAILDRYIAGEKLFQNTVHFGRLHPDLYSYLISSDHLQTVKQLLVNQYFPERESEK